MHPLRIKTQEVIMPSDETKKRSKAEYDIQYAKEHLHRIPLDVPNKKYEEIKAAAEAAGAKVNEYIKAAIEIALTTDYVSNYLKEKKSAKDK